MSKQPNIVIIGGGFGGINAARALSRTAANLTLIDKRNFHLFQPLLYQVATGALSPANIASPLRHILRKQRNTRVLMEEVIDIDVANKRLRTTESAIDFDYLIVATGSTHHYFGHDEWAPLAPGLKTIEDATTIRQRLLNVFELAERAPDAQTRAQHLNFVIAGAGPTGVELAGAFAEITKDTLAGNFRSINPATQTRIVLVEGTSRVLPTYAPELGEKALAALRKLGVEVRLETFVESIADNDVVLRHGESREHIASRNVVWAAGVRASPLGEKIASQTGSATDKSGRIEVQADCSIKNHPEIFVIGDLAIYKQDGKPLPGVAPVAIDQGRFVAKLIKARMANKAEPKFRYLDKGSMATVGRNEAVADIAGVRFGGYFAWLAWLFVHLMQLVGFENKVLVLWQWAFNYATRSRSARIITTFTAKPSSTPQT